MHYFEICVSSINAEQKSMNSLEKLDWDVNENVKKCKHISA